MDPLHPYDGRTRTFRHTDTDPDLRRAALTLIARLLRWSAAPPDTRYHLTLYSGGCGVIDRIKVAAPLSAYHLEASIQLLHLLAVVDDATEDLCWLLSVEEDSTAAERWAAVCERLADERADFQPPPEDPAAMFFVPDSNTNAYTLLWVAGDRICLVAYDQG